MRLAATLPPEKEAAAMNCLFDYLALRQVPQLSWGAVFEYFGGEPAQWLVLFGGSIPEGAELVAKAMREGVARRLMLVGGEGHTTQALRDHIHARRPEIETEGRPEAEVLAAYLQAAHGLRPDAMETRSTNCGNNVSLCLETFRALGERPASLILVQDATMQRRMERTFRKVWEAEPARCLHFAAYEQRVLAGPRGCGMRTRGFGACGKWIASAACCWGRFQGFGTMKTATGPRARASWPMRTFPRPCWRPMPCWRRRTPRACAGRRTNTRGLWARAETADGGTRRKGGVRRLDALLQGLKTYFGYDSFRPGQEALVRTVLQGGDALGVMPTGAGKSVCYQLPALLRPGTALVVSPLISLMQDQVRALLQMGVPAAYLNSSLSEGQMQKALANARAGRYKIIYVAPERLLTRGFLAFAQETALSLVAVDEAHCVSQWGQDFRPSYLSIPRFLELLAARPPVCAFTATATERVREDIERLLELRSPRRLVTGFDRPQPLLRGAAPPQQGRGAAGPGSGSSARRAASSTAPRAGPWMRCRPCWRATAWPPPATMRAWTPPSANAARRTSSSTGRP